MAAGGKGLAGGADVEERKLKLKCQKSVLAEKCISLCEKPSKSSNRHPNPVMSQIKSRNNFDQNF